MAEYTKGPWGWEFFKRDGLLMRYPMALSGKDKLSDVLIASTDAMGTAIIVVEPANAQLIAAAPELLEACIGMLKHIDDVLDDDDLMQRRTAIVTAIAKATGKEGVA